MNATISRSTELSMGHRLRLHEGKCRNYHGHNYVITAYVNDDVNGESGMVLDYSALKDVMTLVLGPYDHAMVVNEQDPFVGFARASWRESNGENVKLVVLAVEPTAENLALIWQQAFLAELLKILPTATLHVTVKETSNTSAEI